MIKRRRYQSLFSSQTFSHGIFFILGDTPSTRGEERRRATPLSSSYVILSLVSCRIFSLDDVTTATQTTTVKMLPLPLIVHHHLLSAGLLLLGQSRPPIHLHHQLSKTRSGRLRCAGMGLISVASDLHVTMPTARRSYRNLHCRNWCKTTPMPMMSTPTWPIHVFFTLCMENGKY